MQVTIKAQINFLLHLCEITFAAIIVQKRYKYLNLNLIDQVEIIAFGSKY